MSSTLDVENNKSPLIRLKDPTFKHTFAYPVVLNENEIILASQRSWLSSWDFKYMGIYSNPVTFDITTGIYKYNIKKQETKLWIAYFPGNKVIEYSINNHTMSIDKINNIIYIYSSNGLYEIDINKQQSFRHSSVNLPAGRSIFVNGQLHLINRNKHFIWNKETKKLDEICQFNQAFLHPNSHKIHYIKSKNVLLLFVCVFENGIRMQLMYVYECSLQNSKWRKIESYKEKKNDAGHTSVVTNDEMYIVLIGKFIKIMEMETWIITNTNIQVPIENSLYFALSTPGINNNNEKYDLLIFGYIRMCCSIINIWLDEDKKLNVPGEIANIIVKYFDEQYIFLFEQNNTVAPKWKISIDDIFNNVC